MRDIGEKPYPRQGRGVIHVPQSHTGYNTLCRCKCRGIEPDHVCFEFGAPKLRGYCPPCFEAKVVEPAREEAIILHNAYHTEMVRINGFRIRNEGSFEKAENWTFSHSDAAAEAAARRGHSPAPRSAQRRVV